MSSYSLETCEKCGGKHVVIRQSKNEEQKNCTFYIEEEKKCKCKEGNDDPRRI